MTPPRLSTQTTIKRVERVPFSQIDGELLAIDVQSGHLYSLNSTGGRVWEAIAEPIVVSDVIDRLGAAFDVDHATCERDVLVLLGALCEAGLAEVVDETR